MKAAFFIGPILCVCLAFEARAAVAILGNPFGMQLRSPPATETAVRAPVIIREAPSNECSTVARHDGAIEIYYIDKPESDAVSYIRSEDGGLTWQEPQLAFRIQGRAHYAIQVIEAADGTLHAVYHRQGEGEGGYRNRLYEVFHVRRPRGESAWSEARRVVPGYVGSIRGFTEIPGTGRLLLAVGRAVPEREAPPPSGPDFGWNDTVVYYSDDGGTTWEASPDRLRVQLHTPNVTRYGAIEPVALPLKEGRIWLLVRDRQGRLQQSFSRDGGRKWPPLERSPFISSDSPAELLRLRDGKIVLFLNSCQFWADPRTYAMGGREVLQAAISADEGKTWRGFREILHETNVSSKGDRGTAYASAAETSSGRIVVASGQGEGKRAIVLFDPDWLLETQVQDDLTNGPVGWTQYGAEGIAVEDGKGGRALALPGRSGAPGGGSWNFPISASGELSLRIRIPAHATHVHISLNDHFTRIDDTRAAEHAVFDFALAPRHDRGAWRELRLRWSDAAGPGGIATLDDGMSGTTRIPARRPAQWGVNYLRIEFAGKSGDAPLLLSDVVATLHTTAHSGNVRSLRLARQSGTAEGGAALGKGARGAFDERWLSCPSVVAHSDGCRLYYSAAFTPDAGSMGIGVADSRDGLQWSRGNGGHAVLSAGPPGAFDAGGVFSPEVIFDGTRYLMWYTGTGTTKHSSGFYSYRIGLATSADGLRWRRENDGAPVLDLGGPGTNDEVQAATPAVLPLKDGGYRMWYAAWAPGPNHTICVARSRDGVAWERENGGRAVEGLDPAIAFGPAVCAVPDGYMMLYMALEASRGIYAAHSRDGLRWQMLNDGKPVLVADGTGFDADIVGHPFARFANGKLQAWYTGYRTNPRGFAHWEVRIGSAVSE